MSSLEQTAALEERVRQSAAAACRALAKLLTEDEPLDVFRALKFRHTAFDPAGAESPLNFVDQVHRTFAYLASIRGAAHLLRHHPEHAPYTVHLDAAPGPDIVSADGAVAAETFAAVTPLNNNKLASDVARMKAYPATHRYVFYYADTGPRTMPDPDVRIIAVN